jgi:hypothetical protein
MIRINYIHDNVINSKQSKKVNLVDNIFGNNMSLKREEPKTLLKMPTKVQNHKSNFEELLNNSIEKQKKKK